jgi:hypothetical protein
MTDPRTRTPRKSIRIRQQLWDRALAAAEAEGYSDGASGVVRRALEEYLARHATITEIQQTGEASP